MHTSTSVPLLLFCTEECALFRAVGEPHLWGVLGSTHAHASAAEAHTFFMR